MPEKTVDQDVLENPLKYLLRGPIEQDELAVRATEIDPDLSFGQASAMMSQMQEKQGILVPSFWRESPQKLVELMRDELSQMSGEPNVMPAERQLFIVEALASIRLEHPFGLIE